MSDSFCKSRNSEETIAFGSCGCGAYGQLFRTGKCAHCYIAELEAKPSETGDMKDALLAAKDLQIECMRIVLSLVSAKAGIESDVLVDMLKEAEERLTHEGQRTQ